MKRRNQIIRSLIALTLVLSLVFPNINASAVISGSNASSNGGKGHTGVFNVHAPGVILTLQNVQNKTTQSDKEAIMAKQDAGTKTGNGSFYDEQGVTVVDQYLAKMPEFMSSSTFASNSALIVRASSSKIEEAKKAEQGLADANGGATTRFAKEYYVNRYGSGSAFTLDLMRSIIWNDETKKQTFVNKQLKKKDVEAFIKANKSALDSAAEKFARYFTETGNTSILLNDMLKCTSTKDEDKAIEVRLRYLDILILVSYMIDKNNLSVVENYLKTLNQDGEEAFSVLFIVPVVSMSYDDAWDWYTLPGFYGLVSGKGASAFMDITTGKGNEGVSALMQTIKLDFTSNKAGWTKAFYDEIEGRVTSFKQSGNIPGLVSFRHTLWWTSAQGTTSVGNFDTAISYMPTDIHGKMTGTLGFTYFSDNGKPKLPATVISGNLSLKAESEQKAVAYEDDVVSAVIEISLESKETDIKRAKDFFESAKKQNQKVKVTLTLTAEKAEGTGENESFFDSFLTEGLEFDGTGEKQVAVVEDMTWDVFEKYMTGETKIQFLDEEIHIKDETKNIYKAMVYVERDGEESDFTAIGAQVDKLLPSVAYDELTWLVDPVPGGGVFLEASSEIPAVKTPGNKVSANIDVSLQCTPEDQTATKKVFENAKKDKKKVKVTFVFYAEQTEGSGKNKTFFDEVITPNWELTTSGGTQRYVWEDVTWETFKPYVDGSKAIQLRDTDIVIEDFTTIVYKTRVLIEVESRKDLNTYLTSTGVQTESFTKTWGDKGEVPNVVAKDEVSWDVNPAPPSPTPTPKPSSHYYSKMEEPYVEIKEGTPGDETFEAMAGVPTTEDLYVGFGATEFITNFEATEELSTDNERIYWLTFSAYSCAGHDEPCVYSCPGHTISLPGGSCKKQTGKDEHGNPIYSYCSGKTVTVYCNNPTSGQLRCSGGANSCSGSYSVTNSGGTFTITVSGKCQGANSSTYYGNNTPVDCYSKIDGHPVFTGTGCKHDPKLNSLHTHQHDFVGKVTQEIAEFSYVDITDIDVWKLTKAVLEAPTTLLFNPLIEIDPQLGIAAFYSQEGYSSNNGRLDFSFRWEDQERYGDTQIIGGTGDLMFEDECDDVATEWLNETIASGQETKATVISDYLVLTTTEGYQVPMYHQYDSEMTVITEEEFQAVHDDSETALGTKVEVKELTGNTIEFSVIPEWDEKIQKSALEGKWDSTALVRSGYNGNFANVKNKWRNYKDYPVVMIDPQAWLTGHPNTDLIAGSTDFREDGFDNQRLTEPGLDIIDSITIDTKEWSPTDSLEPVSNGEQDTGKAKIHYTKVVAYEEPGGVDYGKAFEKTRDLDESDDYELEVGYAPGYAEINDIVIYDPVSTQHAIVLSNDKKYDLRTVTSLEEGGDPPETVIEGCPRNESCSYMTLTCTEPGSLHTEECYKAVVSGKIHVGGKNAHVCTEACGKGADGHVHTDECYNITSSSCSNCGGSGKVSGHSYQVNGTGSMTCPNCTNSYSTSSMRCTYCGSIYTSGTCSCGYTYVDSSRTKVCTNQVACSRCYGSGKTQIKKLVCTEKAEATLTLPYTLSDGTKIVYGDGTATKTVTIDTTHTYHLYRHSSESGVHLYDYTRGKCVSCTMTGMGIYVAAVDIEELMSSCTHELNSHVCDGKCTDNIKKVLICTNPHHYEEGENWDAGLASAHYGYGDLRCWSPCGDDAKHIPAKEVTLGNGQLASIVDTFINLDREFRIYFPDLGDFAQNPTLHGIGELSMQRGMGYTDNMNTTKWVRSKYVAFPVNTVWYSSTGEVKSFQANEQINLNELEYDEGGYGYYTFYCVLGNREAMNATVEFDAIAVNAQEIDWYRENNKKRNLDRTRDYAAKHTAYKIQYIDVVGSIGSLAMNDTGDFRFSTLFKTALDPNIYGWLIPNTVPKVNYKSPNIVLTDPYDVRHEIASTRTKFHDTYGTLYAESGGKGHKTGSLPLTLADCTLTAVQNQYLRPGYLLYMDVETIGDYYGENRNQDGQLQDLNMYYKMQITPRYWELNLDTGVYTPVDVYFGTNSKYIPATQFHNAGVATDWYYYVDWTEESARRNYTTAEKNASLHVQQWMSPGIPTYDKLRLPAGKDAIGTAGRLFLNDKNRTFLGSMSTYGENKNPEDEFLDVLFQMQAQRWQFTLGLPSSSVFVYADEPCTTENIEKLKAHNAVIVCSLNIKVKGEVWTLEYQGDAINNSDGGGIQVEKEGKIYPPPVDPVTGDPLKDPIVAVYSNEFTAKNDLSTEGSH